ncbi:MAG TPA: hypothetical protein EYP05_07500 [Piscirickettsiaceae bacterium]|nr:hypothetical protein [Piscirickettsiaceae bacterium]
MSKQHQSLKNLGLAVAMSMGAAGTAQAEQNPFAVEHMTGGMVQLAAMEGRCGEGKCGNMQMNGNKKGMEEGKCGGGMQGKKQTVDEGKCGNMPEKRKNTMEGKCGEGKCGNMAM